MCHILYLNYKVILFFPLRKLGNEKAKIKILPKPQSSKKMKKKLLKKKSLKKKKMTNKKKMTSSSSSEYSKKTISLNFKKIDCSNSTGLISNMFIALVIK